MWNVVDLTVDFAIHKFLKVAPLETHILTSGLMFGKKSRLLREIVKKSNHPQKNKILETFTSLTAVAKREALIHSYIDTDIDRVTFVEKMQGGDYKTKKHSFTLAQFRAHVEEFQKRALKFHDTLDYDEEEFRAFAETAKSD
jgi:hypothetical protein